MLPPGGPAGIRLWKKELDSGSEALGPGCFLVCCACKAGFIVVFLAIHVMNGPSLLMSEMQGPGGAMNFSVKLRRVCLLLSQNHAITSFFSSSRYFPGHGFLLCSSSASKNRAVC